MSKPLDNLIQFPIQDMKGINPQAIESVMEDLCAIELDEDQMQEMIHELELENQALDEQIVEDEMSFEQLYYLVEQRYYYTLLQMFLKERLNV